LLPSVPRPAVPGLVRKPKGDLVLERDQVEPSLTNPVENRLFREEAVGVDHNGQPRNRRDLLGEVAEDRFAPSAVRRHARHDRSPAAATRTITMARSSGKAAERTARSAWK